MSLARIDTAMVLAAGLGTRMRPLTDDRPKALVSVAGRALIDHMLDRLAEDGVRRAVVNIHHHADVLERHLARRKSPEIVISDERKLLLETGGALVKARPLLGEAPVFVCNIDSLWIESAGARSALAALRETWDEARMDALLLLAALPKSMGFEGRGDFTMDAIGRLKRRAFHRVAPFAYTGVQILAPKLLDGFAEERFSANKLWDRALGDPGKPESNRLYGVRLEGVWMHVGDPKARDAAEERLARISRRAK